MARLSFALGKADFEIGASTESSVSSTRDDDYFDAVVGVDGVEGRDELVAHGIGEGIEFVGPIERDEKDWSGRWRRGGDVGELDVLGWKGGVGGREIDRSHGDSGCYVVDTICDGLAFVVE